MTNDNFVKNRAVYIIIVRQRNIGQFILIKDFIRKSKIKA